MKKPPQLKRRQNPREVFHEPTPSCLQGFDGIDHILDINGDITRETCIEVGGLYPPLSYDSIYADVDTPYFPLWDEEDPLKNSRNLFEDELKRAVGNPDFTTRPGFAEFEIPETALHGPLRGLSRRPILVQIDVFDSLERDYNNDGVLGVYAVIRGLPYSERVCIQRSDLVVGDDLAAVVAGFNYKNGFDEFHSQINDAVAKLIEIASNDIRFFTTIADPHISPNTVCALIDAIQEGSLTRFDFTFLTEAGDKIASLLIMLDEHSMRPAATVTDVLLFRYTARRVLREVGLQCGKTSDYIRRELLRAPLNNPLALWYVIRYLDPKRDENSVPLCQFSWALKGLTTYIKIDASGNLSTLLDLSHPEPHLRDRAYFQGLEEAPTIRESLLEAVNLKLKEMDSWKQFRENRAAALRAAHRCDLTGLPSNIFKKNSIKPPASPKKPQPLLTRQTYKQIITTLLENEIYPRQLKCPCAKCLDDVPSNER